MHRTLLLFTLLLGLFTACQSGPMDEPVAYFPTLREAYRAENALATTTYVEQFWRWPGNSGFDSSIYYVERALVKAGYVPESEAQPDDRLIYRLESRPMPQLAWEPVAGSLTVVGQDTALLAFATNRNMINVNSHASPEGGVEAELVWAESREDLKGLDVRGKIVLMEGHPYYAYRGGVMEKGALGVLTYRMPDYTQPEKYTTSIQFSSIPQDTATEAFGLSLSYAAYQSLKAALAKGPTRVRVNLATKLYPSEELTVVAQARGATAPEEEFVISAHVQEPGANDNASGVACLLEAARVTAEMVQDGTLDPQRTLTFLWGDEITSTRRYVTEQSGQPGRIRWGLSLDMVGQNTALTGGTFLIEKMPDPSAIWTRGEDKHTEWGGSVLSKEALFPHFFNDYAIGRTQEEAAATGWVVAYNPFEGGSDHVPFLDAKIPGLLFWHFTDVFYHTDNDRLDKVSAATLKHVGVSTLATAYPLLQGKTTTALAICQRVEEAALARLKAEAALSVWELENGGDRAQEVDILNTWTLWYVDALQTIEEVELGGVSPEVAESIAKAQIAVKTALQQALAELP